MAKKYEPLDAHLFVCTNEKKGECCGEKGGADLRSKVKDLCRRPEWRGRVRINASGCLGRCEQGIVAVLYPKGEWVTGLSKKDADILVDLVAKELE